MPLLDRSGWKPDAYVRSAGPGNAPALLVPLDALDAVLGTIRSGQRVGIEIANDQEVTALRPVQDRVALIAIPFPRFTDGRGFSLARALRAQGFQGGLRATGHLIPDQLAFALQCGFDEVEIGEAQAARQPLSQWLEALRAIGASYQAGAATSILEKRRGAA